MVAKISIGSSTFGAPYSAEHLELLREIAGGANNIKGRSFAEYMTYVMKRDAAAT